MGSLEVLEKCMKFEPEDRFADVKELRGRLNSLRSEKNARTSVNAKIV